MADVAPVRSAVSKGTECRHGLQPAGRVDGVPVHELEAVCHPIARGHQLDDTVLGMAPEARRLVEHGPASEIVFEGCDKTAHDSLNAGVGGPAGEVGDVDESNHERAPMCDGGVTFNAMSDRCATSTVK
jgi:hypothetical protein